MLTKEENDLLTKVSNGAPMGRMIKQYFWIPAALSSQLEADGTPLRVRLFGEDYVAFRSTDGRVGFFDEGCPHRGVSLALARNEGNGLRCIYHGWKFDVSGKTVEVPTQPNQEQFCKHVPLVHYPVKEAGSIVWVWLGEGDTPPKFQDFEFTQLPISQAFPAKQTQHFNWVQGVETTMDTTHVGALHQSWLAPVGELANSAVNTVPKIEIEQQPCGFRYAAVRPLSDDKTYVRLNYFAAPWYGIISPPKADDRGGFIFFSVPNDDEYTTYWQIPFRVDGPVDKNFNTLIADPANWPPGVPGTAENNWGQNRALMKRGHFSGFDQHLGTEDFAVATSQGPIVNRTKEFLNAADEAVIAMRRVLLKSVKEFMDGKTPAIADHANIRYPDIKPIATMVGSASNWREIFDKQ